MTSINDSWSYRGTALGTTDWNIRILSPNEQVPGKRGENVMVPGLDGRVYRNKTLEQRVISLAMFVKGSAGSALQSNIEGLKALFSLPGLATLSRTVAGRTAAWTIDAEVANVVEFVPISHLAYNIVVEFTCPSPFWEGAAYTVTESGITSSPATFVAVNNGNAYNEYVTLEISGGIVNPKVTVGDWWVQYAGTVTAGTALQIDCTNFVAYKGAADVTGNITHGGGVRWLRMMPGSNTVSLTGSSLGTVAVTLAYTERWL